MVEVKVLGVDLAGSPHRISGICVLAFHKREERVEEEEGAEGNAEGSWEGKIRGRRGSGVGQHAISVQCEQMMKY